jgi:heterodisulfide reductase subunit C2
MSKIRTDKTDSTFKYEVARMPGGENLKKCFSCGTCTGGCPVFRVDDEYNPRRIIRMILLGMRKEVLSSKTIWLCARCYACTANCPQQVNFADIMAVLRDMAIKEGHASPDLPEKVDRVTLAANDLRKDCINLINGVGKSSKEQILEKAKKLVEEL